MDARVVIGLGALGLGIFLSVSAFNATRLDQPAFVGAPEPSPFPGLLGGLVATFGLAMLAWWAIGAMARYETREARGEIAEAVRSAEAPGRAALALMCAGCSKGNPLDAKHCKECGARLVA